MGAEGEVLQRRDSGFATSPALKAALKSVKAAVEEEAKLKTGAADEVAAALKEEITALQKKLAEANAAREVAEKKVEEVIKASPSSPSANEGWFGSLCRCLAGNQQSPEELAALVASQKAELSASLEPALRAKTEKILKETGLALDPRKPKKILESGLDSLGLQHLSKTLSDALDVSEETLTTEVPIEAETTVSAFIERLTAVALEKHAEKAYKEKYGGGKGDAEDASAAAAEQSKVQAAAKAAEDLEATAPTVKAVPKVSPGELLEGEGLSHLSLGEWAECRKKVVEGRAPLLTYLKEVAGVAKLQERQKLASALSKALREERI